MLETREGGCHCGQVRFRASVDLDLLSQCSCTICTKKGIFHLPVAPNDFTLLHGKEALTVYTFGTGVAQHPFCKFCGMAAFYVPRSQPHRISVNARCLDDIDGPSLAPRRFFDGRHWEDAQQKRIAEGAYTAPEGFNGAVTLKGILDRALG
ncbi:MAG TPA: GFA family protein [Rhodopila sp.]|uniref:GFA family protein n=1 Tax=Rhodopila sp. TaxID=2480087 RepID=UPI002BCF685D|nr:GFA family protein [Rhodopila sp.]HVY17265.1 GFA family protein [Rhodopila sp.]